MSPGWWRHPSHVRKCNQAENALVRDAVRRGWRRFLWAQRWESIKRFLLGALLVASLILVMLLLKGCGGRNSKGQAHPAGRNFAITIANVDSIDWPARCWILVSHPTLKNSYVAPKVFDGVVKAGATEVVVVPGNPPPWQLSVQQGSANWPAGWTDHRRWRFMDYDTKVPDPTGRTQKHSIRIELGP